MRNITISITAAFLLCGCAIGPDYVRPKVETPSAFGDKKEEQNLSRQWWKLFGDEQLNGYVQEALTANKDIKIANLQVSQMLAQFDQVDSALYPQIYGNGSLIRQKQSETTVQKGPAYVTSTYAAGLSLVSYEIDIWGKVRRASEAARAQLMSSQYANDAVALSIASSVADNYMRLVLANEQLEIAKDNVTISAQLFEMARRKYQVGTISLIELAQVEVAQEKARSALFGAEAKAVEANNKLSLLLGKNPTALVAPNDSSKLGITPKVPAGLSSELINRRPDIAIAEQALISANAQVGIAKAAYFPTISLTGAFGQQSAEFDSLFKGPSRMWSFTPSMSIPLFTAGKIGAGVRSAEASRDISEVNYEKTVQTAFGEVDTAMTAYYKAVDAENSAAIQEKAMKNVYELSLMKFDVGQIALPALLSAKQSWLEAKLTLANANVSAKSSAITLIKALGGGWETR